jgi:hypothetical protein
MGTVSDYFRPFFDKLVKAVNQTPGRQAGCGAALVTGMSGGNNLRTISGVLFYFRELATYTLLRFIE